MLDVLNEQLIEEGKEPIAFDTTAARASAGLRVVINGVPTAHRDHDLPAPHAQLQGRRRGLDRALAGQGLPGAEGPDRGPLGLRPHHPGGRLHVRPTRARAPDGNALPIPKRSPTGHGRRECIGCGACVAACPNASAMLFVRPRSRSWAAAPGTARARAAGLAMVGPWTRRASARATNHGECEAVCPKESPSNARGGAGRRRAASRSGGATSAERDGRPVSRGTVLSGAAAERGSPKHRPSVTFGCASAPARLPSPTRIATPTRPPTVASGRLGGLPRHRHPLLPHALPEDCQVWRLCLSDDPTQSAQPQEPGHVPPMRPFSCAAEARESRAPLRTRRRAPAGVPYTALCRQRSSSEGHKAVWGSPGNGLPEKRVTATKRPSRRLEVAGTTRAGRTPQATAGRRAGAEARRAPNATAGRCVGIPSVSQRLGP
jgi:succinate dehydrogenase / fumarate reductase iron-sulfur subunit